MSEAVTNRPPRDCPRCGEDNQHHAEEHYDSGRHFDFMKCLSCGQTWTEVYEFVELWIDEVVS